MLLEELARRLVWGLAAAQKGTGPADTILQGYDERFTVKRRKKKKNEKNKCYSAPESWGPSNRTWQHAVDRLGVDGAAAAIENFREHLFSEPHGDWDTQFTGWVDRYAER